MFSVLTLTLQPYRLLQCSSRNSGAKSLRTTIRQSGNGRGASAGAPERDDTGGHMIQIDRRHFIASLGGAAAVKLMTAEAKAEALESYMMEQLKGGTSAT